MRSRDKKRRAALDSILDFLDELSERNGVWSKLKQRARYWTPVKVVVLLDLLEQLRTADYVSPTARRKAQDLIACYRQADQRGTSSKLQPGDKGRLTSFIGRKRATGKTLNNAARLARIHFGLRVSERRIKQIYLQFSNTLI